MPRSFGQRDQWLYWGMVILMTCGYFAIATADGLSKLAQQEYSFLQIVIVRHVIQLVLLSTIWRLFLASSHRFVVPPFTSLHFVRNLLMIFTVPLYMWSLNHLQIGIAIALLNSAPLFTVILSVVILGERPPWYSIAALLVGALGMLMIVQPYQASFHYAVFAVVVAAITIGAYTVLSRLLASQIHPINYLIYQSGTIILVMSIPCALVWRNFDTNDWPLILLIALFANSFHLILLIALRRLKAHTVANLMYIEVVAGLCFGILVFDELPNTLALAGIAVIVAAGILLGYGQWRDQRSSHS